MTRNSAAQVLRTVGGAVLAVAILCGLAGPAWASPAGVAPSDPTELHTQVRALEGQVVDDLNRQWGAWFQSQGLPFTAPNAMIVNSGMEAQSACGPLRSDEPNAFYCYRDNTIWLPLDSMVTMLQSGQFATVDDPDLTNFDIATVVSHEYGHGMQMLLQTDGVAVRTPLQANGDVGVEDFADCAAGWWSYTADTNGYLEPGDLESGVRMLLAMGDTEPSLNDPDPHGTPDERRDAFVLGYDRGPAMCMNHYLGTPVGQG